MRTIILVLWMALAVIVPADILRFKSPKFERLYERFLGFLMRESEKARSSSDLFILVQAYLLPFRTRLMESCGIF